MKQRVITAILAALVFIPIVIIGGLPFKILVFILGAIALYELLRMKNVKILSFPGILSIAFLCILILAPADVTNYSNIDTALVFVLMLLSYTVITKNRFTFDEVGFVVISTIYVGVGFYYFYETRMESLINVIFVYSLIVATDTGAYFFGRAFGKRKLWPDISPNKTIEGSIGGIVSAIIIGVIFQLFSPIDYSIPSLMVIAVLTSVFGQMGDLVESAIKRHYTVKDSGHILPGHGGILDRFDSLIYVLPLLHFLHLL